MLATLPFGRSGHASTRVIFGAAVLGDLTQSDADRILGVLLEYGVNHIDTAPTYGQSEDRLAPWMREHRAHFFLATKTDQRLAGPARDTIHRSLERLRVDRIDLLQLHCLVDPVEWEIAMGPGGALEAAITAREEGLVRFIGVTGHGATVAAMHRRSLERFPFDAVLLPYNYVAWQAPHYAEDFEALHALCRERHVACQTIQSVARRPWTSEAPHPQMTWYEPLTEQAAIDRAVHWVLHRPDVFLLSPADVDLLPRVLRAASQVVAAPSEDEMRAQVAALEMRSLFL